MSARGGRTRLESRLAAAMRQRRSSGAELLDLTLTNPTIAGDWHDPELLADVLSSTAGARYEPDPAGLLPAREALAAALSTRNDEVHPDDLILCASTSEAYSWLFKLCADPGGSILTPVPSYPLLDAIAELESLDVRHVPMQRMRRSWRLERPELESQMSAGARALVVVHPNNPTGHALSSVERAAVMDFCAQQNLPLISDEVFLDFSFGAVPLKSLAEGAGDARVFSLGGLSKMLALPHWKLGWIRIGGCDRGKARAALEWIADTYLSVNTPVQLALPRLLETRGAVQSRLMRRLRTNLAVARELFASLPFVELDDPDGGWSLLIRVPAVESDEELVLRLLGHEGVIVQPGYFYDAPFDAIVVSLLSREGEFREGLARVARVIESLADGDGLESGDDRGRETCR